ncbi:MAG TPA: beta-ketoacyl-[acyl-carrier-protein] synthase family protein [Thermomicrobiales bacterium]|nr:beta-ketoacyl-[acyl-carrier-protein] synthase family protein [Thermomicrobiales bacterium]
MPAAHRVVVTGLGAITSLGGNVEDTWRRVVAGETGIRRQPHLDPAQYPCVLLGNVEDETVPSRFLSGKAVRNTSRFARLAVEAAGEALIDADLVDETGAPQDGADLLPGGALLGTCLGGTYDDLLPAFATFQERGPSRVPPHLHVMFPHNLAAYAIQERFGLGGPSSTVVTACATGAQAIGDAFLTVKYGRAPVMVAGAVESDNHPFFVAGFAAMRALVTDSNDDPAAASRPFDASRAGFVLGEGAGMVVLESWEHARDRGARIYAEVLGFGSSNDAYHPIAPQPEGEGAARAIRAALAEAELSPDAINHINAHAASTPAGDVAEANAIELVYGKHTPNVAVTSIKGAIGHCMGASGAIETVISVLSVAESCLPPTRNYRTPDPAIHLDIVHGAARPLEIEAMMTHSFGLGGQNACLVIGGNVGDTY